VRLYLIGEDHVPYAVYDLAQWALEYSRAFRHVARTEMEGGLVVSTIFTGVEASPIGEPMLFETMVFRGDDSWGRYRYATWEQADAGHKLIVTAIERNRETWVAAGRATDSRGVNHDEAI
jgi:hypothetical protein